MKKKISETPLLTLLCNMMLAYVVFMLCRVIYVWENWNLFGPGFASLQWDQLLAGSLRFDTAAMVYTNSLYVALMLIPLQCRYTRWWQLMCRWLFVVVNGLVVIVNLVDSVYSQYTGRRTTATFFSEFSNESNLGSIVGVELLHHWYLVLAGAALIVLMWWLYRPLSVEMPEARRTHKWRYTLLSLLAFLLYIPLAVVGMRGGVSTAIRPITISNANQYVNTPSEAAIVLNTPFSMIRTAGKTTFTDPAYFDASELQDHFSSIHPLADSATADTLHAVGNRRNIVILIVESLAQEYIGAYNSYPCATPFLDSLISVSLTFDQSYCNGRKSIDGMPSILSSIPMFVEPFFVTSYSLNRVTSVAGLLADEGYTTAFFHGAENGSMGFQAYARTSGFGAYYGRTEYREDKRTNGDADFDGTWAIWDEEFLQYYALKMGEMREPFVTAVFTATSHHPFVVPERYRQQFHQEGHPMHTCIRYVDHALQRFFEYASRQPWYKNTLFVITADHTNVTEHPQYQTAIGLYRVPIVFFDPSGQMPRGRLHAVAQQIDIMPTLMGMVDYGKPYIAYGKDLLATPADSTWAINYNNGIYQYVHDSTLLLFDGSRLTACYHHLEDSLLQHNLVGSLPDAYPLDRRLNHMKAIIQDYMQRMIADRLTVAAEQ